MPFKICFASIDIEHDRGEGERKFSGVENLDKILNIFKKHGVAATLFVTGECLEKYSGLVKEWSKDFEIACHSFTHRFWNTLSFEERKKELDDFIFLYQNIFGAKPISFRAPSHIIDQEGIKLLEAKGFLYDSSVVPHYPFFRKYRGFKGRAPLLPYHPSLDNLRQKEDMKILEIPVRGQVFGIPLAGAWIGRLPLLFYKILFEVYCPNFLTLSLHSWDALNKECLKNLDKVLNLLKKKNYQFLNGKQILKNQQ